MREETMAKNENDKVILKLDGIKKFYHDNGVITEALCDVNLEFRMGEYVVITGKSGSGKSTLLNVLSGLISYEEGELYIDGARTSHFDERDFEQYRKDYIGFVFQDYSLIDNYSVLENVMSALLIQGYDEETATKKANEIIETVGLLDHVTHKARELSSGQKQRLSIARAVAKDTKIIVADEPTGNLDQATGRAIMELLEKMSKDHLVIVVTHNYKEAQNYGNRLIEMSDGSVIRDVKKQADEREEKVNKETKEVSNNEKVKYENKKLPMRKSAFFFSKYELRRNLSGFLLTIIGFTLMTAMVLTFFGTFIMNLDDSATKDTKKAAFKNLNRNRIVVARSDEKELTEEDFEKIRNIKGVSYLDEYDLVNDMFYYFEDGDDYHLINSSYVDSNVRVETIKAEFIKKNKTMRSASALKEEWLSEGRLPEASNEIVIYGTKADLGKEITVYITPFDVNLDKSYIKEKMTVVGVIRGDSKQIFFDDLLCHCLSTMDTGVVFWAASGPVPDGKFPDGAESGKIGMEFMYPDAGRVQEENYVLLNQSEKSRRGEDESLYLFTTDIAKNRTDDIKGSLNLKIIREYNDCSGRKFSILSDETYRKIAQEYHKTQVSIYLVDDSAYDRVTKAIGSLGYAYINPYRHSSTIYNPAKVKRRIILLSVSIVMMFVSYILCVIVISQAFKLKNKKVRIFRKLGMNYGILHRINYYLMIPEITVGAILGIIVFINVATAIAGVSGIVNYMEVYHYIIVIVLDYIAAFTVVGLYHRYLEKNWGYGRKED